MKGLARFGDATTGAIVYLLLVVVVPTTSLVIAGLLWLWHEGYLLGTLVTWLATTLVAYAAFLAWPRRRLSRELDRARLDRGADGGGGDADDGADLPDTLETRPDWTTRDREAFGRACARIERAIEGPIEWERMRELSQDVVIGVASEYHGEGKRGRLRFTLPEALLLVSVATERYRRLVLEHVPFADRITLASVAGVAEHRKAIERGATVANNLRRGGRLVNPMAALVGELRDQFTNRVFASASAALQKDLMRLLLQEMAQAAIDLYGGRLKVSDTEVASHRTRALLADGERLADTAEPLRVLLVGQIGAGKSSLVNALAASFAAETDVLPTTDRTTVHALEVEGLPPLHLVDTAGLDGDDPDRRRELVDAALEADLVCHVARATQPGRAPDAELARAIDERFAARPERRPPPRLLVLTHVDLLPPRGEWSPPYALALAGSGAGPEGGTGAGTGTVNGTDGATGGDDAAHSHARKAATIAAALGSARERMGLAAGTTAVPVRLDPVEARYNVDTLAAELAVTAEAALAAQLNRRRVDRSDAMRTWRTRLRQAGGLALGVGKVAARAVDASAREGK